MSQIIKLRVNGRVIEDLVADNLLLVDYLRDHLGLTGTKTGCDGGECGACTVLVDGVARLSCITLAASADGAEIETIEGQARGGHLSALQRANSAPSEAEIKEALGGNLCRCTGYVKIIRSVQAALEEMA